MVGMTIVDAKCSSLRQPGRPLELLERKRRRHRCTACAIWAFSTDLIAPDPGWRQKSITGRRNPHRRVLTAKQAEASADGSNARSSNKFAADSPLEGTGFELLVPIAMARAHPGGSK
jgi:hypothetical protein